MVSDRQSGRSADGRDRISRALGDERRRLVLEVLDTAGTPVALCDLARLVARREADRGGGRVDDRVDADHVARYHKHVPKLDDVGLVDWDRDRDLVRPGRHFEDAIALVDAVFASPGGPPDERDRSTDRADASGHRFQ